MDRSTNAFVVFTVDTEVLMKAFPTWLFGASYTCRVDEMVMNGRVQACKDERLSWDLLQSSNSCVLELFELGRCVLELYAPRPEARAWSENKPVISIKSYSFCS